MKTVAQSLFCGRYWGPLILMVLLLATPALAQRYTVLPQFASGYGWSSDVFLTNQTAQAVTGVRISFYGNDGSPLSVDSTLGANSAFTINMNPGESQIMRVTNTGPYKVGYIVVRAPVPGSISVTEVFRYVVDNTVVALLGVPQLGLSSNFTFPVEVDLANGVNTAMALANPTFDLQDATPQTLVFNLIDSAGTVQRTALVELGLGEHMSKYINEVFEGLDNFTGSVSVSGTFFFGLLPLRQDGPAFGSVAVDSGPVLGPFKVASPTYSETEPNDSRAQAQAISGSCLINGSIGFDGDLDYFYFDGTKGDVVSVMVDTQELDSYLDSEVSIQDSVGTELTYNDQNGLFAQNDSFAQLVLPATGRYYVRVSDYWSFGAADYTYQMHIRFQPGQPQGDEPQITSLNPTSGTQGTSPTLVIQGSNLSGATGITFTSATGITVSNIQSTATQVTANLTIAADAPAGTRSVTVTTGAGTSNALNFTVNASGGGGNYDGIWTGTSGLGSISFTISGGKMTSFTFGYNVEIGCCKAEGESTSNFSSGNDLTGNSFSFHNTGGPGTFTWTFAGTFSSSTSASGSLNTYLNAPVYPQPTCCSGTANTTWTATRN